MSAPVRLGPVLLSRPIGTGGMGHVWLAHHPEGVPVAVKLLLEEFAGDERLLDLFRFEVRSVASLDHPAIVRVYDYGVVSDDAAAASGGRIGAGVPWLAMEYASGGSFAERHPGVRSWDELAGIVLHLLDGLAHSHARGLVHRDLKPHNVLVRADGTPTLTDFGIAHALRTESPTSAAAGTPGYMAPEQVLGRVQDMGPWTDLYSLGTLVYALLAGRPPFIGETRRDVLLAQLNDSLPKVTAPFPIPDGGEAWLARMLERQPEHRFRCAADAAWAFGRLGTEPTLPPPLPIDWRSPRPPTTERPKGMGLAVFLLRPWPLVGRAVEQDQLWEALRSVVEDGEPRGVLVSGEAGLGTTRLARWIGERAQEAGAAEVLWVRPQGRAPGLREVLASHLRVPALDREDTTHVLESWLRTIRHPDPAGHASRFAALLTGEAEPDPDDWIPVLRACASERPLLLVVDDVHRPAPAVEVARRLLDTDVRVLVVATVNPDLVVHPGPIDALRARALELRLGPLPDGLQRELVDKGTGLAPRLARELVARTHGNPRYAVEAVFDWARRGLLVPTSTGFDLREAAAPTMPRSIRESFEERLAPLSATWPRAGELLELLAALGGDRIRETDWLAVAEEASVPAPDELLRDLERRGVARPSARPGRAKRWRLGHPLMRDTLVQRAIDAGRHDAQHRAAGRALVRLDRASAQDRGLRHLVEIGEVAVAVRTTADLVQNAELERRLTLHAYVDPLLDHPGVDPATSETLRTLAARDRGAAPHRPDVAKAVSPAAPISEHEPAVAFVQVEYDEDEDDAEPAGRVAYLPTGAPGRPRRPPTREVPLVKEPSIDVEPVDPSIPGPESDPRAADPEGWLERARALLRQGEPEEATTWLERAERAFRDERDRLGEARATVLLGAAARASGDLQAAVDRGRRGRDTLRALGEDASEGDLEVALAQLARGELAQARFVLERLVTAADCRVAWIAATALLCCVAEDRSAWRQYLALTIDLQRTNPVPEVDAAWPLEWAGRRAATAGADRRAREALTLAEERYRRLGDEASAARVAEVLASLG